jgi:hypothetical protein
MQSQHLRRIQLWLFATCLVFFVGLTRGHFQSTDEIAVFQQARSLWDRLELDVVPMVNTRVGPNGRSYAAYGIGQSVAAAPLYGAGTWLRKALAGHESWTKTFAGPIVGGPAIRWGGEVEIFVVALFAPIVTALLCVQFFTFSMALGASLQSSLLSTALFATSSYIAGFSSSFLQHSLEALTVFSCFYLLFLDGARPSWSHRALAGALAAYGILVRAHILVLLPALSAYLVWNAWSREPSARRFTIESVKRVVAECAPFACLVGLGITAQIVVSYAKFGQWSYSGAYGGQSYDEPLLKTLYGFSVSPGKGMLIYTPLLIILPAYWKPFFAQHRAAAWCALAAAASYLIFFAKYEGWHGAWFLGPRYLAATVPFLLVPFAVWWEKSSVTWRAAALALGAAGVFVQLLHVSVNFSYVWFREHYDTFRPKHGYLFIPELSPLAAYYRALISGDQRVDMWLVNVYRAFGASRLMIVSVPLGAALVACFWRLARAVKEAASRAPEPAAEDLPQPSTPLASAGVSLTTTRPLD